MSKQKAICKNCKNRPGRFLMFLGTPEYWVCRYPPGPYSTNHVTGRQIPKYTCCGFINSDGDCPHFTPREAEQMICPNCDQDHGDVDWRYCPLCGEELVTEAESDEMIRDLWEGEHSIRAMRRSDPEGEEL